MLFIVFQQILSYKERDTLTNKLIAKNFVDYSNVELAKLDIKKKEPKEPTAFRA